MKIISVVGWKHVGKTTLIECLTDRLSARGLRVGYMKHVHCSLSDTLEPNADSSRLYAAGAEISLAYTSGETVALLRTPPDVTLLEHIFGECSVVFLEGEKSKHALKIAFYAPDLPLEEGEVLFTIGENPWGLPAFDRAYTKEDLDRMVEVLSLALLS